MRFITFILRSTLISNKDTPAIKIGKYSGCR